MTLHIPINMHDIHRQTGVRKGKLVHNKAFGWGIYGGGEADFACYTPPYQEKDKTSWGIVDSVVIESNMWVIEFKPASGE